MAQERQPLRFGKRGQRFLILGGEGHLGVKGVQGIIRQSSTSQLPPSQGGSGSQSAPPKPPPAR
jgi:hypothetical protein